MSKAKFAAAKELIDEKDYAGARAILKGIDHPTARAWEAKLDAISPVAKSTISPSVIVSLVAVTIIGVLLIAVIVLLSKQSQQPNTSAIAALPTTDLISNQPTAPSSPLPPTWTSTPNISPTPTCDAVKWWVDAEPIVIDFLDAATTAGQTPRAALASILLTLNSTYRKFDRLKSADCDAGIGDELSKGMKMAVDGFNDFLGQHETYSGFEFSIANQHFFNAYRLLSQQNIKQVDSRIGNVENIWGGVEASTSMGQVLASMDDQEFLGTLVANDLRSMDLTLTAIFATSTALFSN